MENIFDFIQAALPWVTMGLLLAIFSVRSAAVKRKDDNKCDDYGTEGMCLGTAIGTALGNNTGLGISLGMLIGLATGTCMKKENGEKGDDEK